MTRLSDTQLEILGAAAQRDDRNVLPLPGSLRGGAAAKVVGALLKRGLIAETATEGRTKADAALNRIWRNDDNGQAILLHITDAGLAAIGVEPESGDETPTGADEAPSAVSAQDAPAEAEPAPKARTPRPGTKQAKLIEMLRAEGGATIDEIVAPPAGSRTPSAGHSPARSRRGSGSKSPLRRSMVAGGSTACRATDAAHHDGPDAAVPHGAAVVCFCQERSLDVVPFVQLSRDPACV